MAQAQLHNFWMHRYWQQTNDDVRALDQVQELFGITGNIQAGMTASFSMGSNVSRLRFVVTGYQDCPIGRSAQQIQDICGYPARSQKKHRFVVLTFNLREMRLTRMINLFAGRIGGFNGSNQESSLLENDEQLRTEYREDHRRRSKSRGD
jgi:hypothetical protein